MEVGLLNRRVELINCGRVKTPAGGWSRADGVEVSVWCADRQASASEQRQAERSEQRINRVLVIRWRVDLAYAFGHEARARLTDGHGHTRELAIKTVHDPDGRCNWLHLGCLEGGPK